MSHLQALYDEQNSLLFWFPKIRNLDIPVPRTVWVEFPTDMARNLLNQNGEAFEQFQPYLNQIMDAAKKIGYPVFIRTDMASHKHGWDKAAYVRQKDEMLSHILDTIEFNELAGVMGLNYKAIIIREFLELDWRFKAFHGNMPVAKERRYFVKDGEVLCHHPYWIESAIMKAHEDDGKRSEFLGYYFPHKLPNKWQEILSELNHETQKEVQLLTVFAKRVSEVVNGYWSVDFAYTRDEKWFLIDMANGHASWHPDCNKKLEASK